MLDAGDRWRLAGLAREHHDDTLDQLRQRGGFRCRLTTIWRALRRRGMTFQKKTQHANERDRPDVRKQRRSYRRRVKRIEPKKLIFVDETGATTAMTPAAAGRRAGRRVGP